MREGGGKRCQRGEGRGERGEGREKSREVGEKRGERRCDINVRRERGT